MEKNKISLLLVEPTPLVRDNITRLISLMDKIEFLGSVDTASDALKSITAVQPDIMLIDINLPDMNGLKLTEAVKRDFTGIQVIILSKEKYYDVVLQAMRIGASDFITHNVKFEDLYETITRATHPLGEIKKTLTSVDFAKEILESTEEKKRELTDQGKIITFYSPKGGSGLTTLAINLAISLQDNQSTVVLVDSSIQFGDVTILLNEVEQLSLIDLVTHVNSLDEKMVNDVLVNHKASGIQILPAPPKPELAENVSGFDLIIILKYLKKMFNYIIINTSSFITDPVLASLDISDIIILLSSQDVVSIKSLQSFLGMWDRLGKSKRRFLHILNRYDKNNSLNLEIIRDTLNLPVDITFPLDESTVRKSTNLGLPFIMGKKELPIAKAIFDLQALTKEKLDEVEDLPKFRLFPEQ